MRPLFILSSFLSAFYKLHSFFCVFDSGLSERPGAYFEFSAKQLSPLCFNFVCNTLCSVSTMRVVKKEKRIHKNRIQQKRDIFG